MYVRKVDGQEINLQVSGMLWNRSLVMRDEETGSLWSHLLGRSMEGKFKGKELESIPSVITDWQTWSTTHPQTDVMIWPVRGRSLRYDSSFYRTGDGSRFVIGIATAGKAKAYSFVELRKQPLINDRFSGRQHVLWYEDQSGAAWAFDRNVDGQLLEFELENGKIFDKQTKSEWNFKSGKCVSGQYLGKSVKPIVVIPSYKKAWDIFHPESEYWSANQK